MVWEVLVRRHIIALILAAGGALAANGATRPDALSAIPLYFEPAASHSAIAQEFLVRPWNASVRAASLQVPLGQHGSLAARWFNASPSAAIRGVQRLPGASNYLVGDQASKWRRGVPQFARVEVKGLYPGVDVSYYGRGDRLEFDLSLAPHVDPRQIALRFQGVDRLNLTRDGQLVLTAQGDAAVYRRPKAYQWSGSRQIPVEVSYRIGADKIVMFRLGKYDHSRPLVIDPVLTFSTYLGGTSGNGMALDKNGMIYVLACTRNEDLPTTNPVQGPLGGGTYESCTDMFVAKLDPANSQLVYVTYLGSSGDDYPAGIAVDSSGDAYVTGVAGASDWPLLNPISSTWSNPTSFITKLNSDGSALVYSTYFAGGIAGVDAIAVDSEGNAYIAGGAASGLATKNAFQPSCSPNGAAFLAKIDSTGSSILFSTYLGGSTYDVAEALAVDPSDSVYVTGKTESADFPQVNPIQQTVKVSQSSPSAFVAKFTASGSVVYSTYFGALGGGTEGKAITADASGNAYVTGWTVDASVPLLNPIEALLGGKQCFIGKLSPGGSLAFSTLLEADQCTAIAVDGDGRMIAAGSTVPLPLVDPIETAGNPPSVGYPLDFVTILDSTGSSIVFSTYLGSTTAQNDLAAVAADANGNVYFAGDSWDSGFPTAVPISGGQPRVVAGKIATASSCTYQVSPTDVYGVASASPETGNIAVTAPSGCVWNAISDSSIAAVIGPKPAPDESPVPVYLGSGSDTVPYQISYSSGPDATAEFMVAGKRVVVHITGYGCSYELGLTSDSVPAAGASSKFFTVATGAGCMAEATSNDSWISIVSQMPASGGQIYYAVSPNAGAARTGTITIAGQSFTVNQAAGGPALSITKTHTGDFKPGQTGATYTVTVANSASAAPTSGTVTVRETVPQGMALVSMAGSGWACSSNTCIRSDTLNPGGTYPAITVAVNVADDAGSPLVNSVSVSGGGSATESANDSTVVRSEGAIPGDLDGNGTPDLFWQNDSSRQVGVWYLSGPEATTVLGLGYPAPGSYPGWTLVTVADLDGNGVPDLIWQNDNTRQVGVWYMGGSDGTTLLGIAYPAPGSYPGWRLASVTDVDGDGVPDLVWQNDTTREVGTWLMSGPTTVKSIVYQAPGAHPGWTLVGMADMDANGVPDLVWQNDATRQVGYWYMRDATTVEGYGYAGPATNAGWSVIGMADLDNNGTPDLIWQNDQTREVGTWYMGGSQGTTVLGIAFQAPGAHPGWRALGPK
jgi:uncharacterized repeat protein (TIGR01451 family)